MELVEKGRYWKEEEVIEVGMMEGEGIEEEEKWGKNEEG